MLERDGSDRSRLRFGARLSGTEGYLRVVPGSLVPGSRVLPDVGQLELARAAVAAAAGADATEVELEQVEWLCPVEVGADGLELRVELFAEGDGRSGYEITSLGADGTGVVHSQGIAVVARVVGSAGEGVFEERAVEGVGTLLARRDWRAGEVGAFATGAQAPGEHVVLLCLAGAERVAAIEAEVRSALPHARCVVVARGAEGVGGRYETSVRQVLELLRQIMRAKPKQDVLIQAVMGVSGEDALPCGLSGLLKTAAQEQPKLKGQVIGIDAAASAAEIVARLEASAGSPDEREVRYIGGERQVASWSELRSEDAPAPWRDGGVYLITGGAGGLGLIFAEAIARGAKTAVIVLTGRSELDERRRARLSAIEGLGARVEYRVVDVADGAAVTALIASVRESHGGLTGILHAAGVIRDSFLLKKTAEEAQAVLAPKVAGVLNLDEATRELTLEFMALFGSASGTFGNVGQGDYAAANAFLGGYAAYRNARVSRGERWGRTVSIAWPLWRDGGMQLAEAASRLQHEAGLVPLATTDGVQAFYRALAADADEVLVLSGQQAALRALLRQAPAEKAQQRERKQIELVSTPVGDILPLVQAALLQQVSEFVKVDVEDIDPESELSEYGFDSISFTTLAHQLNELYGLDLMPTIFFEYPTLGGVAGYLAEQHRAVLAARFAPAAEAVVSQSSDAGAGTIGHAQPHRHWRSGRFAAPRLVASEHADRAPSADADAVAVIGMSGRFPMAEDIPALWRNLVEGRDCIGEIPPERWDWRAVYGDPLQEANKTNVKWGGFIDGVDEFDPLFFGISPREARADGSAAAAADDVCLEGDRGCRLLCARACRAARTGDLRRHGHAAATADLIAQARCRDRGLQRDRQWLPSVGPNRMSYLLNLHGPSEPIETACSSSLVAMHRAVQAIRAAIARWRSPAASTRC